MNSSRFTRRAWLTGAAAAAAALASPAAWSQAAAQSTRRPFRIYAVTFRGMTDVEKGFEDYFASKKIPVEITYRDLNRDPSKFAGFIEEIRATRPDLVYTWGTSVTLGIAGAFDAKPGKFINDIPVVFTLVAAPVLAKIVPDTKSSQRNVTGVMHVVPTATQIEAMAAYRPFQKLGVLYTPTEQNSVVVLDEIRKLGRARGFDVVERTFRRDGAKKVTAEGAADLVGELKAGGAQWLYLPPDSFLGTIAEDVVIPAATDVGLPTFASTEQLMQAGALSGLVCRYYSIGQFTAHKAEQILVERRAASSIPMETLTRFSYQIRMAVAEKLKLPPPLGMFNYAELVGEEPKA